MNRLQWISNSRVVATVMILLCHTISYYAFIPGHAVLPQFFNMGVQVFILISGWLFGLKSLNTKSGYGLLHSGIRRFLKIATPCWIAAVAYFVVTGCYDIKSLVLCLSNIQGLSFLSPKMAYFNGGPFMEHTWFVTIILLCYALLPFLDYLAKNAKLGYFVTLLWVASFIAAFYSFWLLHFALFATAYYMAVKNGEIKIKWHAPIVVFLISVFARLLSRSYLDDTYIYLYFIVSATHGGMAFSILLFFKWLSVKHHLKTGYMYKFIEGYSYYIYIVHYGIIPIVYKSFNLTIATIIYITSVVVFAIILRFIDQKVEKTLVAHLPVGVK